jgi:hypothetical protein
MVCDLCQSEHTIFEIKKDGLCKNCQKYLIPTFLRKQQKAVKPYLIKGGQYEKTNS